MKFLLPTKILATVTLLGTSLVGARSQSFPPNLAQPGTKISNVVFGTSPSIAVYQGTLYVAYRSNSNGSLIIASSTDGLTWTVPSGWNFPLQGGTAPALAVYNGYLWIAYVAGNIGGSYVQGALYLSHTTLPLSGFSNGVQVTVSGNPYYPNSSPTLAVFNNQLWITSVYDVPNSSATNLETYFTTDGSTFSGNVVCGYFNDPLGYEPQTGAAVGMFALNSTTLFFGYQTQGGLGGHSLRVCSQNASGSTYAYYSPGHQVGGGVSAAMNGSYLIFAYKDESTHDLILTGTSNGSTFSTATYSGIAINGNQAINPSETIFNGLYYVTYTENSSSHYMWITHN